MRPRLYLITPPKLEPHAFCPVLESALDGGDVACVQLRLKGDDDTPPASDDVKRAVAVLMPVVQGRDVAFIVNDDVGLAVELGCDGAHIGQDDMGVKAARERLGADAILGVSCHDQRHLAMDAAEHGADYVAFGAFYPTRTKVPKGHPSPEILEVWSATTTVPCVAIGGITLTNAAPLVRAGADFLAVVTAVWAHPEGPAAAVAAFNSLIDRAVMDRTSQT